ncbi:putative major facilitator superfamily transporter [Xylariaceae sp. FL0255]|nr:putative major facilitator superfamily transporter [Xylariaceae sp. FL0255]
MSSRGAAVTADTAADGTSVCSKAAAAAHDLEVQTRPVPTIEYSVFSPTKRRLVLIMCAAAGFFSPFSAFTYFPAIEYIAKDLGVSLQLINLTITLFLVVQGIAPAVIGDLAHQIGRRPVYILVLILYFAACVGLAVQRSYPALLILRMIQSAGSSGTIALGIMVVSDLVPPHARGRYVGALLSGPNCGPSIGPVIGGVLTEFASWPWIFWLLSILGGICLVPFAILFPETCRGVVGNGAYKGGKWNEPVLRVLCPRNRCAPPENAKLGHKLKTFPNPFTCLRIIGRRHDALLLSSNAAFYIAYSCLQASLAPLLMQYYHLNPLQAGLSYLSYGIATISSSYIIGKVLDLDYRISARQAGITINKVEGDDVATFPIERARIRSLIGFVVAGIAATVGFGWSIETRLSLAATLVVTFIAGIAYTGVFNSCLTLNVDLHPDETGLASVAASVTRCLSAAVGVAILQPLLNSIGPGWTFTVYGFICVLALPMLLVLRIWGPSWRGCSF